MRAALPTVLVVALGTANAGADTGVYFEETFTAAAYEGGLAAYGKGDDKLDSLNRFKYEQTAEFVDQERKFRWWNGKAYMMFGKYAKKNSLQEIVRMDPGYLEWILSANFSEEVKALVSNALKGQFPVFELKDEK